MRWKDGDDVCLLWIKGGAGKGKTMMSIGLIEQISELSSATKDGSVVVTYFFCQNADYELNRAEAIVKGLIRRLFEQREDVGSALRKLWDDENRRVFSTTVSLRDLWGIFLAMVDQCECRKVFVVIDALDECASAGMIDLLRLITRTGLDMPRKLKWLLTSRPLDAAEQTLLAGHEQVQVSLELESAHISRAVDTYISHKVGELNCRHRYGPGLRQKIESELMEKAEGTFLWVSLVCKRIEKLHERDVLLAIRDTPPGLRALYSRVFSELGQGDSSMVKRCMRLLKAMMLAFRPLAIAELESVIGLGHEEAIRPEVVERCTSFIMMRKNSVEFVHQSARDYLAGINGDSPLEDHESYGHGEVALSTLAFLADHLKANLLDLPRPDSTWTAAGPIEGRKENELLAKVEYAATFWMQHVGAARSSGLVDGIFSEGGQTDTLLSTKFLEWLECLSLLQRLPIGVETLKTLGIKLDEARVRSFWRSTL